MNNRLNRKQKNPHKKGKKKKKKESTRSELKSENQNVCSNLIKKQTAINWENGENPLQRNDKKSDVDIR